MRSTACKIVLSVLLPFSALADWRADMDGLCWTPPVAMTTPAAGLWYHYLLNESNATTVVTDASANANHATSIRNTSLLSVAGKIDKGFKFNGTSDRFTHPSFPNSSQFRTFAAWMKAISASEQYIISDTSGGTSIIISPTGNANKYTMVTYDTGAKRCASTTLANDSTWHHVAGTWNNKTQIQIYVDGKIENTMAIGDCGFTTDIIVGSHPAPTAFFSGYLDDVRIYSRVLSSNEIFNLWNNGNGTEADQ